MAGLGLQPGCDTTLVALSGPAGECGTAGGFGACPGLVGFTVQTVPASMLCSCPPLTRAAAGSHTGHWRIAALAKDTGDKVINKETFGL